MPPLPIAAALLATGVFRRSAASQAIRLPRGIDRATLTARLQSVLDAHDMLRARLCGDRLITRAPGNLPASDVLQQVHSNGDVDTAVERHSFTALDRIDPTAGRMLDAVWIADADLLLLTVHHLVADAVSWQILVLGLAGHPAGEVTTYREFSRCLHEYAQQPEIMSQREYWGKVLGDADPPLGQRLPDPAIDTASSLRSRIVDNPFTPIASVRAVLLAALTLASWRAEQGQDPGAGAVVTMTDVPTDGIGFGLLTAECPEFAAAPAPQVAFNYLGRGDLVGMTTGDWSIAGEYALRDRIPRVSDPNLPLRHALSVTVGVTGTTARPRLLAEWRWHGGLLGEADVDRLTALWARAIEVLSATP